MTASFVCTQSFAFQDGKCLEAGRSDGRRVCCTTLVSMIERCPSGALTLRFDGETNDYEGETEPTIAVIDNGPLWVIGSIPITLADGTTLEPRNRVTLCRCGQSESKPCAMARTVHVDLLTPHRSHQHRCQERGPTASGDSAGGTPRCGPGRLLIAVRRKHTDACPGSTHSNRAPEICSAANSLYGLNTSRSRRP